MRGIVLALAGAAALIPHAGVAQRRPADDAMRLVPNVRVQPPGTSWDAPDDGFVVRRGDAAIVAPPRVAPIARGALVLHGEQEFVYHRTPVAGDVLDGVQSITDIYEKETDAAHMTFVVMETAWSDAATSQPVVTERFNLIARLKK